MLCLGKVTIHPDFINVSNYIHPITLEAATEVASNLRPDDLREVEEGHGIDPTLLPFLMSQNCLLYTSPSPRDLSTSRMPSSA